jgi:hypothetical protein
MNLHKNRNVALLFLFAGCTIVASLFFKVEQTAKAQSFTDGFVKIRNKNWNRCLNLQSATQNGVATNAWECVAHPDQEWKIEDAGSGFVKIRNKNWNRCLNLQSATQNGVAINAWECVAHPDQEWKIEDAGSGFVKIRNKNWNRCLNLQSATQNGVAANAWECVAHPDQEWKIENVGVSSSTTTKNFPLRGSNFTELGDHRRMETSITISNNGRIDAVTRIWTAKQFQGFTGAVAVVITDSAGNVLHVTEPHSYGVDCKRCPGPSDRTQQWADTVPSNILNQVRGYAIIHTTNPRNRWRDWLRDAKEAAQSIKEIKKEFD